jgi:hypothetical protein
MVGTGIILCIQDFSRQAVNLLVLVIFTISCCSRTVFGHIPCYWPFVILVIIGIIYRFIRKRSAFGLADYIATFAISFIISSDNWHIFLMLCGWIGILIGIIQKSNETNHIPFIPAILISALITRIQLLDFFQIPHNQIYY